VAVPSSRTLTRREKTRGRAGLGAGIGAGEGGVGVAADEPLEAVEVRVAVGRQAHAARGPALGVELLQGEGQQGEAAGLGDGVVHHAAHQRPLDRHRMPQVHRLHGAGDHLAHGEGAGPADAVLPAGVDHRPQPGVIHAAVVEVRADGGQDPEAGSLRGAQDQVEEGLAQGRIDGGGEQLLHLVEDRQPLGAGRQGREDPGQEGGEGPRIGLEVRGLGAGMEQAEAPVAR
jgi:hypothetical protein